MTSVQIKVFLYKKPVRLCSPIACCSQINVGKGVHERELIPSPHLYHITYSTAAFSHAFDQICLASVELGHLSRHNDNKEIIQMCFPETISCIVLHLDFFNPNCQCNGGREKNVEGCVFFWLL